MKTVLGKKQKSYFSCLCGRNIILYYLTFLGKIFGLYSSSYAIFIKLNQTFVTHNEKKCSGFDKQQCNNKNEYKAMNVSQFSAVFRNIFIDVPEYLETNVQY